MKYILMHRETSVAVLSINDISGTAYRVDDVLQPAHLPVGLYAADSKELASVVLASLDETLSITESRGIKADDSYYLLKKSPTPTIIVECGFLSNYDEACALTTDSYQDKIARGIYLGICEYLSDI